MNFYLMDPPDRTWWHLYQAAWPVEWKMVDLNRAPTARDVYWYDLGCELWETPVVRRQLQAGSTVIFNTCIESMRTNGFEDFSREFPNQLIFINSHAELPAVRNITCINVPEWFWFVEYYTYAEFKDYTPTRIRDQDFLLMINRQRTERDTLWNCLKPCLNRSLHSYKGQGIGIKDDVESAYTHVQDNFLWDRYINPAWYERTQYSIVVETNIRDRYGSAAADYFLTEKTLKPIVMQHPFLLYSTQGALSYIRAMGFETWPELWDESYDQLNTYSLRARAIAGCAESFDSNLLTQTSVQEKLQHNHRRFFDPDVVNRLFQQRVVAPVLNSIL